MLEGDTAGAQCFTSFVHVGNAVINNGSGVIELFLFRLREHETYPAAREKAHPGRIEQKFHPENVAVEGNRLVHIVHVDGNLTDFFEHFSPLLAIL